MAKDANRFYVDVCLEIYVPDQGFGEKAVKNENLDAEWFANEICNFLSVMFLTGYSLQACTNWHQLIDSFKPTEMNCFSLLKRKQYFGNLSS